MATKVRRQTSEKKQIRFKRKARIRKKVLGTQERLRMSVFRSNTNIYVQLVDDVSKKTLVSASTLDEELKAKSKGSIEGSKALGQLVAKRALAKNITKIVFDRGGYLYHGRIKALADSAREAGLKF